MFRQLSFPSLKPSDQRQVLGTVLGLFLLSIASAADVAPGQPAPLPEAEVRQIVTDRLTALAGPEDGIGIVVGLIGPSGRRVIASGHFSQGDPREVGPDTVFEIASVTKVFTGLLLAEMAQKNEIQLTEPVAQFLPSGTLLPARNGRGFTFLDLATHTSGLPFMPDNAPTQDADLYRFLAGYKLTRDIGAQWEYSNIDYWLLSQVMAARAKMDFPTLLQQRILAPLKLTSTGFALTPPMQSRLAAGHNASLQPAPLMNSVAGYSLMPAAGGLYSTVDDLLSLLAVALGYQPSPLASAFEASLKAHRPMGSPGTEQALGWIIVGDGDDRIIYHDGGSFGYASALAWDPARRMGVVVLSNHVNSVVDIARHLFRPDFPLTKPSITRHAEITLEPAALARFAGRYEATGEGIFVLTLENGHLTFEAPPDWGLPKMQLHAESQMDLFAMELPLRVTLQEDGAGHVTGLLIHPPRGQHVIPASRIR